MFGMSGPKIGRIRPKFWRVWAQWSQNQGNLSRTGEGLGSGASIFGKSTQNWENLPKIGEVLGSVLGIGAETLPKLGESSQNDENPPKNWGDPSKTGKPKPGAAPKGEGHRVGSPRPVRALGDPEGAPSSQLAPLGVPWASPGWCPRPRVRPERCPRVPGEPCGARPSATRRASTRTRVPPRPPPPSWCTSSSTPSSRSRSRRTSARRTRRTPPSAGAAASAR